MDSIIDMRALLDGVDPLTLSLWMCALLLLLVLIGVRVAFAAAFVGLVGLCLYFMQRQGFDRGLVTALKLAGQVPHSKSSGYALSLIPTFIVIGYLAYYAGLTRALFEMAKRWVGWVPGGLGVATVFATAGFAAVSGASVATSAVFARIAIPEMLRLNYDKAFAAGVVAAGGTLASLIPPSAILVIYAIIVEESVGKLLLAGFLPGFVSALIYAALVIGLAKTRKNLGPPVGGFTWGERFASLPGALPIFFVIFIIIFSIYYRGEDGAWATPTEAGALGAFVVLCMAVAKGMNWGQLKTALMEAAKLTAMIFAMIWGVLIFVRFLGFAQLPDTFAGFIAGSRCRRT
jgi:C4-dicarboxylate transporter DctM subunit